jgi:hypothetical protein
MTIRNRELSQFGSFIFIDDASRGVGITTLPTPFVGIGTASPQYKLDVHGDTNITGNLFLEGDLVYSGSLGFGDVDLNTSGIITASAFFNTAGQQLSSFNTWTEIGSNAYYYNLNGRVGVGTTNPTERIEVIGNIKSQQFISTATGTKLSGTAPLQVSSQRLVTNLNADYLRGGEPGGSVSGDIVTIDATQTLTNKSFSTGFKIANTDIIASSGIHTITFPAESGTVLTTGSGVLTGVVTTGNIQNGTILNEDIANNTIQNAKLVNSTISGISLGGTLGTLGFVGSYWSGGSSYNGSSAANVSLAATFTNTGNTLVARNASGDFSAASVSVINLSASQTITAQDFNSTSDISLKTNIKTIENSLDLIDSIRGVSFDWVNGSYSSMGVIAQEIEEVLPQLVNDGEHKSVNYNGLIGVLIESIKELRKEIEELKSTK